MFDKKIQTFPDALSNAATISKTDVPLPVPKLYTSQPTNKYTNDVNKLRISVEQRKNKMQKFYIKPCPNHNNMRSTT